MREISFPPSLALSLSRFFLVRQRRSCFSSRSFSPPEGARKNPPDFVARDGQADGRDLCFYATTHHLIMLHRPAAAKVLATQFAPSQHQSSPRLNVIRESSKVDLLCSVRVAYRSVSVSCFFFLFGRSLLRFAGDEWSEW